MTRGGKVVPRSNAGAGVKTRRQCRALPQLHPFKLLLPAALAHQLAGLAERTSERRLVGRKADRRRASAGSVARRTGPSAILPKLVAHLPEQHSRERWSCHEYGTQAMPRIWCSHGGRRPWRRAFGGFGRALSVRLVRERKCRDDRASENGGRPRRAGSCWFRQLSQVAEPADRQVWRMQRTARRAAYEPVGAMRRSPSSPRVPDLIA